MQEENEVEVKAESKESTTEEGLKLTGQLIITYCEIDQWRERKALTTYCELLKTGNRKDKKLASDILRDIKKYST